MAGDPAGTVTVEGCLVREVDVPGRAVPEEARSRAVSDNDFVLTDTKMVKGSQPEAPAAKPSDSPVGTSGTSAPLMYKVKGESLKMDEHAGQRVQIDGAFEHQDRAKNPVAYAFDLVRLNGTAIRQVPGDCPKK
jgi:hypothetical protein